MRVIVHTPTLKIYHGRAVDWDGDESIDVIFTNPYGLLPSKLRRTPAIIHQWKHRQSDAEAWCGFNLYTKLASFNDDREWFWANDAYLVSREHDVPRLGVLDFRPTEAGWWPEEMVELLVDTYLRPGQTVWDGFMGRGTLAKVCQSHGMNYIGVEQLQQHIAIALNYLELNPLAPSNDALDARHAS